MSITIDFCFNYPKNLEELTANVNEALGCCLMPVEDDPEAQYTSFMGMDFSLMTTEGFGNDGDMDIENFGYIIGFKTWGLDPCISHARLPAIVLVIFTLHQRLRITGILVYERFRVLARYEERQEGICPYLFDVVSQTPLDDFPEHLKLLYALENQDWTKN